VADLLRLKVTLRIKPDVTCKVTPEMLCIRNIVEGVADPSAFCEFSVLMTDPTTLNQVSHYPRFSVVVTVGIRVHQWKFQKQQCLIS